MIGALVVLTIRLRMVVGGAWSATLAANLEQAVSEREQAQQALRRVNDELEARVTAPPGNWENQQALQAE